MTTTPTPADILRLLHEERAARLRTERLLKVLLVLALITAATSFYTFNVVQHVVATAQTLSPLLGGLGGS